jgi:AbrB family looped-hinge helix DNA binding protein
MKSHLRIDHAGRVVLPKAVREELGISPGDTLDLLVRGGAVTLRPRGSSNLLLKERGVWVFRTGQRLSAAEAREAVNAVRSVRGGDSEESR